MSEFLFKIKRSANPEPSFLHGNSHIGLTSGQPAQVMPVLFHLPQRPLVPRRSPQPTLLALILCCLDFTDVHCLSVALTAFWFYCKSNLGLSIPSVCK